MSLTAKLLEIARESELARIRRSNQVAWFGPPQLQSSRPRPNPPRLGRPNDYGLSAPPFLVVAIEIRNNIYRMVFEDILKRGTSWHQSNDASYQNLLLVCQQVYQEVQAAEFRFFVRQAQIDAFCRLLRTPRNFKEARSLMIEMPVKADIRRMRELRCSLGWLRGIQELQLRGPRCDLDGQKVGLHSCGNLNHKEQCTMLGARPLSAEDQNHVLLYIYRELKNMTNLRTLVIKNVNMPLNPYMLIGNKSQLRHLFVTADPRSESHNYEHWLNPYSFLFDDCLGTPSVGAPLKALHISMNATYDASDVVSQVAATLEHLTIVVPNPAKHKSNVSTRWYVQAGRTIHHLATQARAQNIPPHSKPALRTLRLCLGGYLSDVRTRSRRNHDIDMSMCDFLDHWGRHLGELTALENLEIHGHITLNTMSLDVVDRLPRSVRHLYLSSGTIQPRVLVDKVQRRILKPSGHASELPRSMCTEVCCKFASTERESQKPQFFKDKSSTVHIHIDDHNEVSYGTADPQCKRHNRVCYERNLASLEEDLEFLTPCSTRLGDEDLVIPLGNSRLRFITYEIDEADTCHGNPEEIKQDVIEIIKLNGRLLDREHNLHMHDHPENQRETLHPEYHASNLELLTRMFSDLGTVPDDIVKQRPYLKDVLQNQIELDKCLPYHPDFGMEVMAEMEFFFEETTTPDKVKYKSTVDVVSLGPIRECEWSCPAYDVPSVNEYEPVELQQCEQRAQPNVTLAGQPIHIPLAPTQIEHRKQVAHHVRGPKNQKW